MALVPQGRPRLRLAERAREPGRRAGHRRAAGTWSAPTASSHGCVSGRSNRADKLSGGKQGMLAICRALMSNPCLLLMDEPTEGLAPLLVRRAEPADGRLGPPRVHVLSRGEVALSRGWPERLLRPAFSFFHSRAPTPEPD